VVEGFVTTAGDLEGTAMVFVGLLTHEGDFGVGEVGVGGGKEEEEKGGDDDFVEGFGGRLWQTRQAQRVARWQRLKR
jgi:hypothetical protein